MAYAKLEDVAALLPKWVYDDSTKPSKAQVQKFIDDISAELDSILRSQGYTTPVTTPADFVAWLKQTNALGAAALTSMGQFPAEAGAGSTSLGEQHWKIYQSRLEQLRMGEIIPPDVPRGDRRSKTETYLTRNPDEEVDLGDIAEPWHKRDKVF